MWNSLVLVSSVVIAGTVYEGCWMALLVLIDVTDVMPHGALCCLRHASLLLPPVNVHFSHSSP